ncbi:hypothetical protein ALC53_13475 [Atta colombica]|uniref:Uncharacterized protein n=1 Tax=Atta colombica TaxID=520822 RepID=A0A195AVD7_9HYME|nr:hypothetical protein ALC53_13475 [Atta colombica]
MSRDFLLMRDTSEAKIKKIDKYIYSEYASKRNQIFCLLPASAVRCRICTTRCHTRRRQGRGASRTQGGGEGTVGDRSRVVSRESPTLPSVSSAHTVLRSRRDPRLPPLPIGPICPQSFW